MKELTVSKTIEPIIDFNFDEMKAELQESMVKYKNLVVTDENYKDCKVIRKDLTRMKKSIDDFRKAKKKEMSAPIKEFEDKCKALYGLIEDVEKPIKDATDRYDDEVREQKKIYARCAIEVAVKQYCLSEPFADQLLMKDEYSNLSASKTKVKEDIEQRAQWLAIEQEKYEKRKIIVQKAIEDENETLTNKLIWSDFRDFTFNATDSSEVLKKVAETALRRREAEQRVREEVKKEEFVPVKDDVAEVIEDLPEDEVIFATVEASGNEKKMDALVAFMKATGIEYEIKEWVSF